MVIKNLILLILILFLANCSPRITIENTKESSVTIDDINDLTRYIKTHKTIYIKSGNYRVNQSIWDDVLTHDVSIVGLGKVTIECTTQFAYFKSPAVLFNEPVKQTINRKSNKVTLKTNALANKNVSRWSAYIASDDIVETAWKYKKSELLEVADFRNGSLFFKDATFFDYQPSQKTRLSVFDSKKVTLKNITFHFNKRNKWDKQMPIRLDGCRVALENITAKNFKSERKGWFMGMYYCHNIEIKNIHLENFLYGLVINISKNVSARNIVANDVVHPIVPATFTKNVRVDGMRGNNISTDAHVAINVHYNDVDIDTGDGIFNCRAFGVKMTNCKFTSSMQGGKPVTYIGVGSLTEQYKPLYKEYDVHLDNVEWLHNIQWLNGLHVNNCRNFVVNNCNTHCVSTGGFLNSFVVKNSKIGHLQSYDTNFKVINTTFDAQLQGLSEKRPPLTCSWSGKAEIDNCRFLGFEEKYLFAYVHSPESFIEVKNSELGKLKGFVKKYGNADKEYRFISFENCTFDRIEQVPPQLRKQKNSILKNNIFKRTN